MNKIGRLTARLDLSANVFYNPNCRFSKMFSIGVLQYVSYFGFPNCWQLLFTEMLAIIIVRSASNYTFLKCQQLNNLACQQL